MANGLEKSGMLKPRVKNAKRVSSTKKTVAAPKTTKAARARTSSTSNKPVTYAEARSALKRMMRSGM